ncbi:hypothetical protein Q8W71_28940 [Methylobacterium sp. NEAU 140]|uniref:hypothetical protein n=1 Tax=Methylobacterium sp. NEAU 140 TaxID=3064945 RepID=UPI00273426BE|nr:hypothetical protein [Methylobacterium sp. NEAU 140]MDP4026639.1 hypothetical protein [Methylobacterium sp. NEAU 140]
MSLIDIRRRLEWLQAASSPEAPTRVLTDAAIGDVAADMRAADALANWRTWIATGRASVSNGVLCPTLLEMTESEGVTSHITAH